MVLVEEWRHLSSLKPLERPVPAVAARDAWSTLFARKQPCGGYATATQVTASVWNPSIQGDAQCHHSNRTCVKFLIAIPSESSPSFALHGKASGPFFRSKWCYPYVYYSGPQGLNDELGTINGLCCPVTMILVLLALSPFHPSPDSSARALELSRS